jgi:polysaccharide pyruvyl transferase WcaK-like protein
MKKNKSFEIKNPQPSDGLKVLLVGYNGANNTGSESRLISIIDELYEIIGKNTIITIPTLNEKNLKRYITVNDNLKIVPIPSLYVLALLKLVKQHDLILLIEGSCYMDSWTSALLWAFLLTTTYSKAFKKPCAAYAVDSGDLSAFNKYLVKREASKTDLIIVRSKYAAERLRSIGVTAPIKVTADTAFYYQESPDDHSILRKIWPDATKLIGISVVDFTLWPVVLRPWGREKDRYKWPYYFSRSKERKKMRKNLIQGWVTTINYINKKYGRKVALICMEDLDEPLAREIVEKIDDQNYCKVFSSRELNTSQMTSILINLDLLITSRYHAAVLSLRKLVPQIAVGHDFRLTSLYKDLELYEDYFVSHESSQLWDDLKTKIDLLIKNPNIQEKILKKGLNMQLNLARQNKIILKQFLKKRAMIE